MALHDQTLSQNAATIHTISTILEIYSAPTIQFSLTAKYVITIEYILTQNQTKIMDINYQQGESAKIAQETREIKNIRNSKLRKNTKITITKRVGKD